MAEKTKDKPGMHQAKKHKSKISKTQDSSKADKALDHDWIGPEYVYNEKSTKWYLYASLITIVLIIGFYFLTKEIITSIVIILFASVFVYYAARKPKQLHYKIDQHSIEIDNKTYLMSDFKSYSIADEGKIINISFSPIKRFAPVLPIYINQDDSDKLFALLSQTLPYNEEKRDVVDNFFERIKF